ncbi:hypothetical protein [Gordonia sp. i37]|uniref:O-methyltransferase n=1 Tax=Gordonia sp. i37 TaxID=1961707 RepID=UPI00209B9C93|nr:hypothetical protein [Gordonia sp. i37]
MTSTLTSEPVSGILDRLYEQAAQGGRPSGPRSAGPPAEVSPQAKADAAEDRYMAIARDTGILAYSLIRSARPAVVVEFGMSYGISALFLAAALRDNVLADPAAGGHLYTTELSAKKVSAAEETFAEAQLADLPSWPATPATRSNRCPGRSGSCSSTAGRTSTSRSSISSSRSWHRAR